MKTFEEWWAGGSVIHPGSSRYNYFKAGWDAATVAERERCIEQVKKVLHTGPDTLGDDVINAIRGQDAQRSV